MKVWTAISTDLRCKPTSWTVHIEFDQRRDDAHGYQNRTKWVRSDVSNADSDQYASSTVHAGVPTRNHAHGDSLAESVGVLLLTDLGKDLRLQTLTINRLQRTEFPT